MIHEIIVDSRAASWHRLLMSTCCPHPCASPRRRFDAVLNLIVALMLLSLGFVLAALLLGGHVCSDEVGAAWGLWRTDVIGAVRWAVGGVVNTLKG